MSLAKVCPHCGLHQTPEAPPSISAQRVRKIAELYAGDDDVATANDVFDAINAALHEAGVVVEE